MSKLHVIIEVETNEPVMDTICTQDISSILRFMVRDKVGWREYRKDNPDVFDPTGEQAWDWFTTQTRYKVSEVELIIGPDVDLTEEKEDEF